jgi:alpha-tubulin suppressor-like RCC1 family protein
MVPPTATLHVGAPKPVLGLTNVRSITAGDVHTCAVLEDGTASCWGDNGSGRLGDGTTNNRNTPVAVSGLSNVLSISAGGAYTCAALQDGGGKCWGSNAYGLLGGVTCAQSSVPVTACEPKRE